MTRVNAGRWLGLEVMKSGSLGQEVGSRGHRTLAWNLKKNISVFNIRLDWLTMVAPLNNLGRLPDYFTKSQEISY